MTPDFSKIQSNHVNNVSRTEKKQQVQDLDVNTQENLSAVEEITSDTGVVGRSTVKADNFETDMKKLKENPAKVDLKLQIIDILLKKGYSLEDAVYATHTEFDN